MFVMSKCVKWKPRRRTGSLGTYSGQTSALCVQIEQKQRAYFGAFEKRGFKMKHIVTACIDSSGASLGGLRRVSIL